MFAVHFVRILISKNMKINGGTESRWNVLRAEWVVILSAMCQFKSTENDYGSQYTKKEEIAKEKNGKGKF